MSQNMNEVLSMSADKRYTYLLKQVALTQEIWILTDEHGCLMLSSEDEDCVPVWPAKEFAQYWATGDWAECVPKAISLEDWLSRWTSGLEGDEVNVAVFPNPEEEGLIIFPDAFDEELRKSGKS
jgi:hypothetical protein